MISDTVSLGYGSLPLTVTVSVETHLQSKSFQKPKQDVPVKKRKLDEPVKLSQEIEMLKKTVERKDLSTSTEVEGEDKRGKNDKKDVGEGYETGYRPGTLISNTVSLGYGSLPLTVTVSVETHLQSKSFLSWLLQAGIPFQVPCQSFAWRGWMDVCCISCRFDSLIFPV